MKSSSISKELKLKYPPIAVVFTDEIPGEAIEFDASILRNPCSIAGLKEAADGKPVYFCSTSKVCPGAKTELGFTNHTNIPGGIAHFLSYGKGKGFPEGEMLKKTPEIANRYYENEPKTMINRKYVLFQPLGKIDGEKPKLVIFIANPNQLSALISLYSFESTILDDNFAPMTSGCGSIVALPLHELKKENPRAVIGLIDICVRTIFEPEYLSFTVSYENYLKMELNSKDCFFQTKTWEDIKRRM